MSSNIFTIMCVCSHCSLLSAKYVRRCTSLYENKYFLFSRDISQIKRVCRSCTLRLWNVCSFIVYAGSAHIKPQLIVCMRVLNISKRNNSFNAYYNRTIHELSFTLISWWKQCSNVQNYFLSSDWNDLSTQMKPQRIEYR